MEAKKFKVIIVEDVKLELKGTEEIFRHEIPEAEIIGTAMTEQEFWSLMEAGVPDLVLLDLGLGGSNVDRKSTRLNSSHRSQSRMPSSA